MVQQHKVEQLREVNFLCECGEKFKLPPEQCDPAPERHWHPYEYYSSCPACGELAAQVYWERNRLKANYYATGPRTAEGIAATSANLEGHPTPEEAKLTRFNAIKHGAYAKTATYFPARPGQYAHCEGCHYLEDRECVEANACLVRMELFLKVQVAHETSNPGMLTEIMADQQAGLMAIVSEMIRSISIDGVRFSNPVWHGDKEGGYRFVKYRDTNGNEHQLQEITANPLLRILGDLLAKNHMTLADLNMTPKAQQDGELLSGYVEKSNDDTESMEQFQANQLSALEDIKGMIRRSEESTRRDPVLIEHQGTD